jgi:hypothetical protein
VAKGIAVVLLALSVALTGLAIYQSSNAHAIHEPAALAVMGDNTVWIGTDSALVHASAAGHELESCPLQALGLDGSPSNLMRHPSGELIATQRDDATLYFFAAAGCQRLRTLNPQWPADLARHGGRAINLAFNPDGRFAIATGGDAVALFAAGSPRGRGRRCRRLPYSTPTCCKSSLPSLRPPTPTPRPHNRKVTG